MHGIYADARFDDLDLDTSSQWIGRGKQYFSYGIQTAHDGRLMFMLMFVSMTLTLFFTVKTFVTLVLFVSLLLLFYSFSNGLIVYRSWKFDSYGICILKQNEPRGFVS